MTIAVDGGRDRIHRDRCRQSLWPRFLWATGLLLVSASAYAQRSADNTLASTPIVTLTSPPSATEPPAPASISAPAVVADAGDTSVMVTFYATTTQALNLLSFDVIFDPALCGMITSETLLKQGRSKRPPQEDGPSCPGEGRVRIVFLDLSATLVCDSDGATLCDTDAQCQAASHDPTDFCSSVIPAGSGAIANWQFDITADAAGGVFPLTITVNRAKKGPNDLTTTFTTTAGLLTIVGPSTATPTSAPTATPTETRSSTPTGTSTASPSPTPTSTPSQTRTMTLSPTGVPIPTSTPTANPTSTPTNIPLNTPTQTPTPTTTFTATSTATSSQSPTPTSTHAPTVTSTLPGTPSVTPTASTTASFIPSATPTSSPRPPCVGDCDRSGDVQISEIITMVNIALGTADVSACAAGDADGNGSIEINEIIAAVNNALNGC